MSKPKKKPSSNARPSVTSSEAPPSEPFPLEGWIRALTVSLLVLSAYAASFSFSPVDMVNGLDGSWFYAFSKIITLKPPMILGRDISITYGPLSSLWGPVLPGSQFEFYRGVGLLINVLLVLLAAAAAALFARVSTGRRFWPLAVLLGIYPILAIGHLQGLGSSQQNWTHLFPLLEIHLSDVRWTQLGLMLAVISAVGIADNDPVLAAQKELLPGVCFVLLAMLAATGMFVKFSTGWELLLFSMFAFAWRILTRPRLRWNLIAVGVYLLTLTLLWHIETGGGLSSLGEYLADGLRVSSSYSEFSISNISMKDVQLYLFPAGIVALDAVLGYLAGGLGLGGLLFFNSFLQFKHSVVRADSHLFIFFAAQTFTLLCLAGVLSLRKSRRVTDALYFALLVLWFSGFQSLLSYADVADPFQPRNHVFSGLVKTLDLASPGRSFAVAEAGSVAGFAQFRKEHQALFSKLNALCSPEKSITILPWELSAAELTTCRWRPMPTLQMYISAQFPGLQASERAVFSGPAAPDIVLLDGRGGIDHRSLIADMSHIMPEILERYEVAAVDGFYLILKRRAKPLHLRCAPNGIGPHANKLLRIRVAGLKNQPWFNLQNALFKGPEFNMLLTRQDSRGSRNRVFASQLQDWTYFSVSGTSWEELFQPLRADAPDNPINIQFVPVCFAESAVNLTAIPEMESCGLYSDSVSNR
jgi:hypothetical protein